MMMINLKTLVSHLDSLLDLDSIPGDSSNNGLQVEGTQQLHKAIFAVDASLALFQKAVKQNANFIFVHHGLSWGGGIKRLTGLTANRINLLFSNNISLYAAHLPLDAHPQIGHNALLADIIKLQKRQTFAAYHGVNIGFHGELPQPAPIGEIAAKFDRELGSQHTIYGNSQQQIKRIGLISGGSGMDGVLAAAEAGLDCLVTGEFDHCSWHYAKEADLTIIALGHYCSEKPGVLAVKENIEKNFKIKCDFIDLPTGL